MFGGVRKIIESLGTETLQTGKSPTPAEENCDWGAFSGVKAVHIRQMDLPRDKVLPHNGLVNAKCAGANLADCYIHNAGDVVPLDAYLMSLPDKEFKKSVSGMISDANTVWSNRASLHQLIQDRMRSGSVKIYDRNLPGLNLTNACIPSVPLNFEPRPNANHPVWHPSPSPLELAKYRVTSILGSFGNWCQRSIKLIVDTFVDTAEQSQIKTENKPESFTHSEPSEEKSNSTITPATETKTNTSAEGSAQVISKQNTDTQEPRVDTCGLSFVSPYHEEIYLKAKKGEEYERAGVVKGSKMMGTADYDHLQSRLYSSDNLPAHRQIDIDLVYDLSPDAGERRNKTSEKYARRYAEVWEHKQAELQQNLAKARENGFNGVYDSLFQEKLHQADEQRSRSLLDEELKDGRVKRSTATIQELWDQRRKSFANLPQDVAKYDFLRKKERIENMPLPELPKVGASSPSEALEKIGFPILAKAAEKQSLPNLLENLEAQVRVLTVKQLEIQAKYENGLSQRDLLNSAEGKTRRVTMYNGGYDELTANYKELLQAEVEFALADFIDCHFTHAPSMSSTELAYLQRAKSFFDAAPVFEQEKLDDARAQAASGDMMVVHESGNADEWWIHGFIPVTYRDASDSDLEKARAAGTPYKNAFGFVVDKSQLIEEATEFNAKGRWFEKKLDPLGFIGMPFGGFSDEMPYSSNRFRPLYLHIGVNELERVSRPRFYTELGGHMGKTDEDAVWDHAVHAYRSWDIARHRGVPGSLWSVMEQFALISKQCAEFYLGCRYSVCMNKQLELGLPAAYVDYFARSPMGRRYPQWESVRKDELRRPRRFGIY
jgi:hypothetical protein